MVFDFLLEAGVGGLQARERLRLGVHFAHQTEPDNGLGGQRGFGMIPHQLPKAFTGLLEVPSRIAGIDRHQTREINDARIGGCVLRMPERCQPFLGAGEIKLPPAGFRLIQ